ncbi:hypothetical protein BH10CYA1_BH10CYA1_55160 [soil metagenome]
MQLAVNLKETSDGNGLHSLDAIELSSPRVRLSPGLVAICFFIGMNFALILLFNHSRNCLNSDAKTAARIKGTCSARATLFDLPLFMWALQNPLEQNLDAAIYQLNSQKPPQVILLGSSLMQYPTWFADMGNTLPQEAYYHFRSKTIAEQCVRAKEIFNLSVPLLGVSDAAKIVDSYLSGPRHPEVLVYGVGPRDFYDNLASAPSKSQYFNFLIEGSDYLFNRDLYFKDFSDCATSLARRTFFVFQRRHELLAVGKNTIKEVLHRNSAEQPANLFPMNPQRNLDEYKLHYKGVSKKTLSAQFEFLNRMLGHCHQQGIKVVLVSMPLTRENKELLPGDLYLYFNESLKNIAAANHQKFLDANETQFNTDHFLDSVHLNAGGSRKFLNLIAPMIDSEIKTAH